MILLHQELMKNNVLQISVSQRASVWAFELWKILVLGENPFLLSENVDYGGKREEYINIW